MTPFDELAGVERWVAWRNEPRGPKAKPTKVPYSPHRGRARANDPKTWGTRAAAEAMAKLLVNGLVGGVGFELGDVGHDHYVAGLDLDSCLDEEGRLAEWAAAILVAVPSYAEISPSGTGIKIFFYVESGEVRPFLDRIAAEAGQWGTRRGVPGHDGRDHGPAIEIYFSHHFFAVTDNRWPGAPDRIIMLEADDLKRLAPLVPPPRQPNGTAKGGDNSRSAKAFRKGAELRQNGATFEEMVQALGEDPETADWVDEKGRPNGMRELRRIWDKAEADNGKIIVKAGERHIAADEGIAALQKAGTAFYQRDRKLVRVCKVKARAAKGDIIFVPGIAVVTPAILERELGKAAQWERLDPQKSKPVRIDPPRPVVNQILDMIGEWPFPPIAGVIGCPTLRHDGSLLADEGYDIATGLVLISAVTMPRIPEDPTRADALGAVGMLDKLLIEFPFADPASKSVARSMMMTPVLRGAMNVPPMHVVRAPESGSGKSYLANVASMISTGERVAVKSVAPNNPEETEKRLIASALAGYPIIGLDNCRETLEGAFLCQLTEQPLLELRVLGKSDVVHVANTFTTFATGNNVTVADDLVRRTIFCSLDANVENPEGREFLGDPIADVQRNRGAYVAACIIIARAYIGAGKPGRLPRLPSYEGWSDLVRSALVWLGYPDPVDTMAKARAADPVRQDRARAFAAWQADLGVDRGYTTAEIVDLAEERHSYDGSRTRPAIHAVLIEVAQKHAAPGQIEPRRLGRWLTKQENTIAAGLKLTVDRGDIQRLRYRLRAVGP